MPDGYIDCHTHVLPPGRLRGLIRWARRAGFGPLAEDATPEDVVADLRRAGARRWVNLLFPLAPGEAPSLHRFGAALAERHPEMTPFGGVHVADEDPLAVVKEAIEDWGMAGLKFHPMVQRFSPAADVLAPVFAYLEERRSAVYIHTGYDEWYGWRLPPEDVEGLVARYEGVAFVLPHIGYPRLAWGVGLAERHPNVWLDVTNVCGSIVDERSGKGRGGGDAEALAALLHDRLPGIADRTMFGTDHPAGLGTIERIKEDFRAVAGLEGAAAARVMEGTAAAFLDRYGRPAPATA